MKRFLAATIPALLLFACAPKIPRVPVSEKADTRSLEELHIDPSWELPSHVGRMVFRDVIIAGVRTEDELREIAETDRRSMTANDNLQAIWSAQAAYKAQHGSWLTYERATAETWKTLGVTLPQREWHVYSASAGEGGLHMAASGNLDRDEFLDRWTIGGRASNHPAMVGHDAINFDYVTMGIIGGPPETVTPFVRELAEIQRRAQTAKTNLELIAAAQNIWHQGHGRFREFEALTPEIARDLGLFLAEQHHRYSAKFVDGELVLRAEANLDPDPWMDVWTKVGDEKPLQFSMDYVNLTY